MDYKWYHYSSYFISFILPYYHYLHVLNQIEMVKTHQNKYAESLSLNIQSDGYKLEATLKYNISSLYWRGFRMDLVAMGSFACWEN